MRPPVHHKTRDEEERAVLQAPNLQTLVVLQDVEIPCGRNHKTASQEAQGPEMSDAKGWEEHSSILCQ